MKFILTGLLCILFTNLYAQSNLYSLSDLSSVHLRSLEKEIQSEWTCPNEYADKKVQKSFCEMWQSRSEYLARGIRSDDFINQKSISSLLDNISTEIYNNNKDRLKQKPRMLIDRSPVVNAYSIGNNIVVVNLGLINFCNYEEELALVVAHEISHDLLSHSVNSMKQKAEWVNSQEYKNFIKDLEQDKYNRLTKVVKTFKEYSYSRSKHGRFGETSADSLAALLLLNTRYKFNAEYFLRLDSSDLEYKTPLKKNIPEYFSVYNLSINPTLLEKRGKGLSAKQVSFNSSSTLEDSLKTHPDCIERFNNLKHISTTSAPKTPIDPAIKNLATKAMIWNLYKNGNLTASMYRLLLMVDNGQSDTWTDFMATNILISLYIEDVMLNRSNAINIKQKEYIGKDYYALQNYFEQISPDDLEILKNEVMKFSVQFPSKDEGNFRRALKEVSADPNKFKYANKKYKKELFTGLEDNIYGEYFN